MTQGSGRGPVVTMATFKGGSGKTTAAACFACHASAAGLKVSLIDADPQGSLMRWQALGHPPVDIKIIAETTDAVGERALSLATESDLVIIDTAGSRNRIMSRALSICDLAIVPVKASPLDVAAALDTLSMIERIEKSAERAGRKLLRRLLFTQSNMGSVVGRHIRQQLGSWGYPVLDAELTNRVVYAEAALSGRIPLHLDPKSPAAQEGEAFAREALLVLAGRAAPV